MAATWINGVRTGVAGLAIGAMPAVAAAQTHMVTPNPIVDVPRVDTALTVTINGPGVDVNAYPACEARQLPCTHRRPSAFGGFGVSAAVAVNLSPSRAIVTDVDIYAGQFDSPASLVTRRHEQNTVVRVASGVRLGTPFVRMSRRSPEPARFFVQALGGVEHSTTLGAHLLVLVGGGVDAFSLPRPGSRLAAPITIRLGVDYFVLPGSAPLSQGVRFSIGVVLGPHLLAP